MIRVERITYYAFDQEHIIYSKPSEIREVTQLIFRISYTAYITQMECVKIEVEEFNGRNVKHLKEWFNKPVFNCLHKNIKVTEGYSSCLRGRIDLEECTDCGNRTKKIIR
jgi:hypothetical protein